jgi:alpha-glucoside transport system permease protein
MATTARTLAQPKTASAKRQKLTSGILVNGALLLVVLFWTIPSIGLLVSSFRTRDVILNSGWWQVLPHRAWVQTEQFKPEGVDTTEVMNIGGVTGTFEQFRQGVMTPDGQRVIWIGNRRTGQIQIQEQQWTASTDFTLDNYRTVIGGKSYEIRNLDGSTSTVRGEDMSNAFVNSLVVTIPATLIPIMIAAFAAYGFAWMRFPGRKIFFAVVVAMLVVPLQIALVPILRAYVSLDLNGTFLAIWLAHTGFGLALATYLLFNYISLLPRDIFESAFLDGATHFTIFQKLVIPLSVPALASFAIFQFLWVWNDYLVALIFIGEKPDVQVLTMRLANIVGSRGSDWHLLTAAAFLTMIVPLIVFFGLQRYFVRGMMAGSVKG